MLSPRALVQHGITIFYDRIPEIRRYANQLEDALTIGCPGGYGAPSIVPIPDDIGPEMPRVIFASVSGFSQVQVSQLSLALTVTYSPDWALDRSKCLGYLKQRAQVLFGMLASIDARTTFVGITTKLQMMDLAASDEPLALVGKLFLARDLPLENANEVNLRWSISEEGRYFSNTNISNVAEWPDSVVTSGRWQANMRLKTGIEILGDFNSRLAYNEDEQSTTSLENGIQLIELGAERVYDVAARFGEYDAKV